MNLEQLAAKLKPLFSDSAYKGELSDYAVQSIKSGRSNYPVQNLMAYCKDSGVHIELKDLATEDCFYPKNVSEVHEYIRLLMDRYNIDTKWIYRKTGVHYTLPKEIEGKLQSPLSIKTLLAVCETIPCELNFIR